MSAATTITDKSNIQIGLLVILLGVTGTWMYRSGGQDKQLEALLRTTERIERNQEKNTGGLADLFLRVGGLEAWQDEINRRHESADQWKVKMDERVRHLEGR